MGFLSFRLISSPEEWEERQKGLSKNGGSASSSTDHPKPSLKQNGVIYHLIVINQFRIQYESIWIHAYNLYRAWTEAGKFFYWTHFEKPEVLTDGSNKCRLTYSSRSLQVRLVSIRFFNIFLLFQSAMKDVPALAPSNGAF